MSAMVVASCGGHKDKATDSAAPPAAVDPASIKGPQLRMGDLIYNITDVHLFDYKSKDSRPYLTNLPAPDKGTQLLGVFLRVYNVGAKPEPAAVGYLLEPQKQPGLVEQNIDVQTPLAMKVGSQVKPGAVYPAADQGKYTGAMLLYPVSGPSTRAQPFDLVIHDGVTGAIAKLEVPHVKELSGNAGL
jgi:hypothetical protein